MKLPLYSLLKNNPLFPGPWRRTLSQGEFPGAWRRKSVVARCQHQLHSSRRHQSSSSAEKNLLHSPFPSIEIPHENLADWCLSGWKEFGEYPAIICGATGRTLTYTTLMGLTRKVATGLGGLGIKAGDKVAVVLPSCPDFAPILLGSVGMGAVLVPISPLFTPTEIHRILDITEAKVVVTIDMLLPGVEAACEGLKEKVTLVTLDGCSRALPYKELLANDGSGWDSRETIDPLTTTAILPFSSGTTGPPKGVELSHSNLSSVTHAINQASSGCAVDRFTPGEGDQFSMLSIIPMFHIYGLTCNILQPISFGCKVISLPKFEPDMFLSSMATHQPNFMNLVPPLVGFIVANPAVERDVHLAKVRTIASGGASLSLFIIEGLKKKLEPKKVEIKEGFGMTECSVVCRNGGEGVGTKYGSVGRLINNTTVKIVDVDTGEVLGAGGQGELCVKGPQVMRGYYKNEKATEDTLKEGWLHSGDIAYYDEEGYIFIVDRIKDMIKVKGYQVSPTELEDLVRKVSGVLDVAVVGVPHEAKGEVPRAFVVRASEELKEEDVHAFLEGNVASYKKLAGGITFLKELPKSPTGKILRKELKLL